MGKSVNSTGIPAQPTLYNRRIAKKGDATRWTFWNS